MNGFILTERSAVMTVGPHSVILVTALLLEKIEEMLTVGANAYITKGSFERDILIKTVIKQLLS
jgi:CheY-like chemotaxis protein